MEKTEIIKLKNGLTTCFVPFQGANSVTLHLRGRVGSNYELNNEIGCAHLSEHVKLSNSDRNKLISNGAKIYGITSRDDVLYMVKSLKEYLIEDLKFLSQVFLNTEITTANLETTKDICIQEVQRNLGIPEKILNNLVYKSLYSYDRLEKPNTGTISDIRSLKIKNLESFTKRLYLPLNFVLVLSGDVDKKAFFDYSEKYFGDFSNENTEQSVIKHKEDSNFNVKVINKEIPQDMVKICWYGLKLSNQDSYLAEILADIIDQSLKIQIKEVLGYSYRIGCSSFSTGSYGIFSINFSSDKSNTLKVLSEIKSFLKDLDKYINPRTLKQAQSRILSQMAYDFEKTSLRADYYSSILLHANQNQNYDSRQEKIMNTSVNDLKEIAAKILSYNPKIAVLSEELKEKGIREVWDK